MTWNVIALSDVAAVPWRNGGGITRELLRWPDAENWLWRISVAEVASDGAFSHFASVQRWLAILTGTGVRLTMPDHTIELTPSSNVLTFAGATPVQCNLLQGPVQDLNFMLRCDDAYLAPNVASMRRVCGAQRTVIDQTKIIAIYANQAPASLQIDDGEPFVVPAAALAWQALPAGAVLNCEASNAYLFLISAIPR